MTTRKLLLLEEIIFDPCYALQKKKKKKHRTRAEHTFIYRVDSCLSQIGLTNFEINHSFVKTM